MYMITELEVLMARQTFNGNNDSVNIVHYGLDSEESDVNGRCFAHCSCISGSLVTLHLVPFTSRIQQV